MCIFELQEAKKTWIPAVVAAAVTDCVFFAA